MTFLGALIFLLFALFFLPLSNKVSSQALSSIAYGISFFPGLTSEAVWSQELFFYLYRYKLTEKITLEISKERGSKKMSFRKMQERGKKGFPRLGKWDRSGYLTASCLHMATHSRTLAWKIPWTEEPGKLQSMGLQRVATSLSLSYIRFPTPWRQGCDLSQHILGDWTVGSSVPRLGITTPGMPLRPAEVGCDWRKGWMMTEERDDEYQLWFQEKLQQQGLQWSY